MKRVLLGLVTLSFVSLASEGTNLYLSTGVDMFGKFDRVSYKGVETISFNKEENDKGGFELTVEATREFYPNLELGLGISYQDHGKPEKATTRTAYGTYTVENTGYKSIPIYAVAKYNIPIESNIKPYLKANFGYSFNYDESDIKAYNGTTKLPDDSAVWLDDGIYYGLGGGIEYNNFIVELMYKVNRAESEITIMGGSEKIKEKYDYSRTTLSFGYRFDF